MGNEPVRENTPQDQGHMLNNETEESMQSGKVRCILVDANYEVFKIMGRKTTNKTCENIAVELAGA